MIMKPKTCIEPRSGQVIIIGACALVVVAFCAVMAIDIGQMCLSQSRLQTAADAGVLAAAQTLVEQRNDLVSEEGARLAATEEAQEIIALNWTAAGAEVVYGVMQDGQFTEVDAGTEATAVQVVTERDQSAPGGSLHLFFGPLLGVSNVNLSAIARCEIITGIGKIRGDLTPFAVFKDDVPPPGETMVLYDKDPKVPGNCGLLDLDGGANGEAVLETWITDGYDGEISIDPDLHYTIIFGNTGWRSALNDDAITREGDTLFVCVYDQVTEEGSNAEFRVIYFLAVRWNVILKGKSLERIEATVERIAYVPDGEIDGTVPGNLCKIQLIY